MERAQLFLRHYSWAVTLLCLTLLAQALGRAASLVIEGALPPRPVSYERETIAPGVAEAHQKLQSRAYYDSITGRNLFNSNPPPENAAALPEAPPMGDLADKAKLKGTIVGGSSAMAMIEVLSLKQTSVYFVGDLIDQGAEVVEITDDQVTYKQGDRVGHLSLDEQKKPETPPPAAAAPPPPEPLADGEEAAGGEGVKQVSDTEFIVDARELESQLSNINQLILQARVVPNFSSGKIDGFKIFAIKPNSIFRKLGLRNGDVIASVNGVVLDNPQKGLQVFQDLQGQKNFGIDVRRRNQPMTMRYEVR
ncbi:MAG: type II secretion system protein GspC [Bdellovibrionota bacterium]